MNYDGLSKYDANVARNYERDRKGEAHWQDEQAFMAAHCASRRLGHILDLPVGTGRFFEYYTAAESVLGIDISQHMLAVARDKASTLGLSKLQLAEGNALSLNCADAQFDTVVCFRLVHLIPAELIPALFFELARVTRGDLLMQIYAAPEPSKVSWIQRAGGRLRRLFQDAPGENAKPWSHIQSYAHTRQFLITAAERAGWRLVKCHEISVYLGSSVDVLELSK